MVGDAGIEHRHDHADAGGAVPCLVRADPGVGILVAPLLGIARVVRGQRDLQHPVDFDIFDARIGGQLPHQRLGLDPVKLAVGADHFGAHREATQMRHGQGLAGAAAGGGGVERTFHRGDIQAFGAAFAVSDDEPVVLRGRIQAVEIDAAGNGRKCDQRGQRDRGCGRQRMQTHATLR